MRERKWKLISLWIQHQKKENLSFDTVRNSERLKSVFTKDIGVSRHTHSESVKEENKRKLIGWSADKSNPDPQQQQKKKSSDWHRRG